MFGWLLTAGTRWLPGKLFRLVGKPRNSACRVFKIENVYPIKARGMMTSSVRHR